MGNNADRICLLKVKLAARFTNLAVFVLNFSTQQNGLPKIGPGRPRGS